MPDDPNKKDFRDRNRVAGDQEHEVEYFAQQNSITPQQARDLIAKHGNDRETLERAAKKLS